MRSKIFPPVYLQRQTQDVLELTIAIRRFEEAKNDFRYGRRDCGTCGISPS